MQGVAGYRVYTRTSGQSYGAGTDVGLLSADLDGVIRYVVRGLSLGVTYYFAVTAYDSAGRESAFSNELSLLVTATPTPTSAAATATASRTPTTTATAPSTPTATATASRTPTTTATAPSTPTTTATAAGSAIATATPSPTTTPAPTAAGLTIWGPTAAPANPAESDAAAVELGLKFTADVNGLITGIRFYKSPTNTGTHTGSLWSNAGVRLATATFTNETASGWQQVSFATPVAITAGTVYVASYHTDVGQYADDINYFATAGVDNPPLHALRDGVSGANGVYAYGASAFPTNSYQASSYWVDVVFAPAASATPTPSPTFAGSGYAVSGRISYLVDGAAVADATLTLQGTLGTLTATTDATGAFSFSGLGEATWNLTPRKQADQRSGVSALDASYVLQRLAGTRGFDAWQTFICDVTGNGTLSALDAVRILEFAVGSRARLPVADACGSDWAFLPQPLLVPFEQVVQPVLSNTNCQLGAVGFAPLSADAPQQNFAAVLIGDCTGNWQGGSGAALRRRAPAARARLGAVRARPGGRWLVGLHIDGVEDLDALEIHVAYDPSAATLEDVHAVGAATGALAEYRADTSGIVSIALASADRIEPGDRPLAVFVLAATDPPQLRLLDAVVDDAPVGVGD